MTGESMLIDQRGPFPVHRPALASELGGMVLSARTAGDAVYPVGGRTMLEMGLPPTKGGTAIDMTAMNQVIDYPARDMTITVQAGITLAALRETLQGEGQWLPVDVPLAEKATLGGAVACNVSGARRYGAGTLRDYVIGLSAVNDRGQEFKAGGRVVKNVAGYDFCKLLTGSLGTLGILTQLTLKVRPLPERSTLLALHARWDVVTPLLEAVHRSRTRPSAIELLNARAAEEVFARAGLSTPPTGWVVLVGFEDSAGAVDWQIGRLKQELTVHPTEFIGEWSDGEAAQLWRSLTDFPLAEEPVLTCKANLLPSRLVEFCQVADQNSGQVLAHAGNGIVFIHLPDDIPREEGGRLVHEMRARAVAAAGNLIVPRAPVAWKNDLNVWGESRGDWPLMREVKRSLDPHAVFNPGRFIGGV